MSQLEIVINGIEGQVQNKPLSFFSRAPGISNESIHVSPEHRVRVVDAKQFIKPALFNLTLACNAAAHAFHSMVIVLRENALHIVCVVRILVGFDLRLLADDIPNS